MLNIQVKKINNQKEFIHFMTKTEFIKKLSEEHSMTQAKTLAVFDAILDGIFETVEQDGSFRTSFGTFKLKTVAAREARVGRNPKTQEEINIPARPESKKVCFTMSKSYKENLNS